MTTNSPDKIFYFHDLTVTFFRTKILSNSSRWGGFKPGWLRLSLQFIPYSGNCCTYEWGIGELVSGPDVISQGCLASISAPGESSTLWLTATPWWRVRGGPVHLPCISRPLLITESIKNKNLKYGWGLRKKEKESNNVPEGLCKMLLIILIINNFKL